MDGAGGRGEAAAGRQGGREGRAYAEQRLETAWRLAQCEEEVVERHRADAARTARRDAGELPHQKERCGASERCCVLLRAA
jgi:hypothetical protein